MADKFLMTPYEVGPSDLRGIKYPVLVCPRYPGYRLTVHDSRLIHSTGSYVKQREAQYMFGRAVCESMCGVISIHDSSGELYGESQTNSIIMGRRHLSAGDILTFHVSDVVYDSVPFFQRLQRLIKLRDGKLLTPNVEVVDYVMVTSYNELVDCIDSTRFGVDIRDLHGSYHVGRATKDSQFFLTYSK